MARFKEVDTNGDGRLSLEETEAWLVKKFGQSWIQHVGKADRGGSNAQVLQRVFKRMDVDHDGSISPAELDSTLAVKK